MKKIITLLILFSFILSPITIFAQNQEYFIRPGILPDSKIYWLDMLGEEVRYFLTFGKIKKANYKMKVAEERLSELNKLYTKGVEDYTEKLLTEYEKDILKAQELYSEVKYSSIEKIDEMREYTEEQIILNDGHVKSYLIHTVPEQYDSVVEKTVGAIGLGFMKLLGHLNNKNQEIQSKKDSLGVE